MSVESLAPDESKSARTGADFPLEHVTLPGFAPVSSAGVPLSLVPPMLVAAEFLAVLLSAVIAKAVYLDYFLNTNEPLRPFILVALSLGIAVYLVFKQMGLYELERLAGPEIFFGKLLGGLIIALLSVLGFLYAIKVVGGLSRGWIFGSMALTAFCIIAVRLEVVRRVKRGMESGLLLQRIAIIGTKDFALSLASRIRKVEGLSQAIDLYHCQTPRSEDVRFIGDLRGLESAMARRPYDRVVVAIPGAEIEAIRATVKSLGTYTTDLLLCSDLTQSPVSTSGLRQLAGIRADVVHLVPLSEQNALLKRTLDLVVACSLLLLLSPLLLLVALAIKLDSPGPVIFQQRRMGQNSTPFWIYKFRSMTVTEDGPTVETLGTRVATRIIRVEAEAGERVVVARHLVRRSGHEVRELREPGLRDDDRARIAQIPGDRRLVGRHVVRECESPAGGWKMRGLDVVLERDRNPVQGSTYHAGGAFGVERRGLSECIRIDRDRRVEPVLICRDAYQVGSHDVLRGQLTHLHPGLEIQNARLHDGEVRRSVRGRARRESRGHHEANGRSAATRSHYRPNVRP